MSMKSLLPFINLGLSILLVLLGIGSSFLSESIFISWSGRFHPLLVHLPIGIWILTLILYFFVKETPESVLNICLNLGAAAALLSGITGIFLAGGLDYEAGGVFLHKWLGIAFGLSAYLATWKVISSRKWLQNLLFLSSFVLLLLTGHEGGNLTHGEDFLFPTSDEQKLVKIEESSDIYADIILPIFQDKCISCHRPGKMKGKLNMTDTIAFLKGGESGQVINRMELEESELLKLVHLPKEDKRHMPPHSKKQLDETELALITEWIKLGSPFSRELSALEEESAFRNIVEELQEEVNEVEYSFESVEQKVLSSLNTDFVRVQPIHAGSPALEAHFFVASMFEARRLKDLGKVKRQLVKVNLNQMPVNDGDLSSFRDFPNLEAIFLNGTNISINGLSNIANLPSINTISLLGTKIGRELQEVLPDFKNLDKVFISDTRLDSLDVLDLRQSFPTINFQFSKKTDEVIELPPPVHKVEGSDDEEKILLSNVIQGTEIYYSFTPDADKDEFSKYEAPIITADIADLRAFSRKKDWIDSPMLSFLRFKDGFKPDSVSLLSPPNDKYPGYGGATLNNAILADAYDVKNKKWIGYRENSFHAICYFKEARNIQTMVISYGINVPIQIFNPGLVSILVNGKKIESEQIQQIPAIEEPEINLVTKRYIKINVESEDVKSIEVKIDNLQKIPKWHYAKGKKAWLFLDEFFFYE